ncbi:MAG: metallophosphoesterase [Anaerolineae bacterium]|nr:metallophosphoesterase [Anaerolineae bacterium]
MAWNRVLDLEAGIAMVVTDLHGDGEAYARYRDRFLDLHAHGQADFLILAGDLLHRTPPDPDNSLAMILDVLRLKAELGDRIIYLMGNHEMPHRYSFTLQRGNDVFTPRFEWAMADNRPQIMALLDSLPFYVRTKAGVSLCHAGAFPGASSSVGERLFALSHEMVLAETAVAIPSEIRPGYRRLLARQNKTSYDQLIHDNFAITSPDDPRYDDPLIGSVALSNHPDLSLLWNALFTRNEIQHGRAYPTYQKELLHALSYQFDTQATLVTGHIDCESGYTLVNKQQLRLASAKHAHPRESGHFLLFDVGEKISSAEELLTNLGSVFS